MKEIEWVGGSCEARMEKRIAELEAELSKIKQNYEIEHRTNIAYNEQFLKDKEIKLDLEAENTRLSVFEKVARENAEIVQRLETALGDAERANVEFEDTINPHGLEREYVTVPTAAFNKWCDATEALTEIKKVLK